MHISVIGTGYVGLVIGACLAEFGSFVTCIDKDISKIESLQKGITPFYEPGLGDLVWKNLTRGRLTFTTDIAKGVADALVIFIAVGTPPRGDGSADLRYVEEVAKEIACHIKNYTVIVTKSTVPIGTGERIRRIISENLKEEVDFDIVSNPEFLRQGSAIEDFMHPSRVIIGAKSAKAIAIMKDLYRTLYLLDVPFLITDIETAELIKYASNSFLATKISFVNELAKLCEKVGADINIVAKGMGLDERIGSKFLHAGPGYGGSCLPKDTQALLNIALEHDVKLEILSAVIRANKNQLLWVVEKIKRVLKEIKDKTITILGLSFKPDTDDIRESPAIIIIKELLKEGASIRAYDPSAMENTKSILPSIVYCKDPYEACEKADALIIVTEWKEFRNLDLKKILMLLKEPYFIDLRNVYEPSRMKMLGFKYYSIGRPSL
ncbi:MAG: UDP-glucose/GDP-mannose dehydrogenase family protein [Thermodesulfovibrionales bacterium]|nr:UDP-glucose/GDP-mannose dehydrogenase family protein [Thermodesulfovibrionales bacterium]